MTENIELLSKKAAMKGLESSINIYLNRIEGLAAQHAELGAEIADLESATPEVQK